MYQKSILKVCLRLAFALAMLVSVTSQAATEGECEANVGAEATEAGDGAAVDTAEGPKHSQIFGLYRLREGSELRRHEAMLEISAKLTHRLLMHLDSQAGFADLPTDEKSAVAHRAAVQLLASAGERNDHQFQHVLRHFGIIFARLRSQTAWDQAMLLAARFAHRFNHPEDFIKAYNLADGALFCQNKTCPDLSRLLTEPNQKPALILAFLNGASPVSIGDDGRLKLANVDSLLKLDRHVRTSVEVREWIARFIRLSTLLGPDNIGLNQTFSSPAGYLQYVAALVESTSRDDMAVMLQYWTQRLRERLKTMTNAAVARKFARDDFAREFRVYLSGRSQVKMNADQ